MKCSILKLAVATTVVLSSLTCFAQEPDAEDCNDHPFFNRMDKYYISDCKENYSEHEFTIGNDKTETMEGHVMEILYSYDGEFGPGLPSRLQIIRNYENAVSKIGGKKIYSSTKDDSDWVGSTFLLQKDGKEYWVSVFNLINNPVDQFSFIVLAKEGMKQEIDGSEMFNKIISGESLTLYINFETGKSNIKNDSQYIIAEIYNMLASNPDLKIIIDGHTDNVGNKESNQTLSKSRAESVKNALVTNGVSAERISTEGHGQNKPIAENSSEDGRHKNRRVEIRKL